MPKLCSKVGVRYYPYVESAPGVGKGLLEALAADACVVVTDEFPMFFSSGMVSAAARKLTVRLEAVDSNGLLPLRSADRAFTRAFDFRRHLQKVLPAHLEEFPSADPLSDGDLAAPPLIPANITGRWPAASQALLNATPGTLDAIPIDHLVKPTEMRGGHTAGRSQMTEFLKSKFPAYSVEHNKPELRATSQLSPYLHFGHISTHEIFAATVVLENWRPEKLALRSNWSARRLVEHERVR